MIVSHEKFALEVVGGEGDRGRAYVVLLIASVDTKAYTNAVVTEVSS
ncbi:MAG TPA: hypothetical protein V6C90_07170 [Coleofasciculaceae cyanobacterium]